MGSGETSPTMIKLHRELIEAAGPGERVMLDTSFGFQVNADDLTSKIQGYFSESIGVDLIAARWRRSDDPVVERERALAHLSRASWAFAGPGSPSYALRNWQGTAIPDNFVSLAERGGVLILGSAAAATAGAHAIPVYEIYKVGDDPYWLEGLNVVGRLLGLEAVVVPHFDNREGGRHDTRFCYIGEQKLTQLEAQLPAGVGILGVDEHTAVVFDLSTGGVSVHGTGGFTVRVAGESTHFASGATLQLTQVASLLGSQGPASRLAKGADGDAPASLISDEGIEVVALRLRRTFDGCLAAGDAEGALGACLELEEVLNSDEGASSPGRQHLRAMLVGLAGSAERGLGDPREAAAPYVDVLLDLRGRARASKDFATSDVIRDGLANAGVEVRDTPDGVVWEIKGNRA